MPTDAATPRLRPAVAGDEAGLARMLAGLSPDSAYHRFMGGVGAPSPGLVTGLVKVLLRSGPDRAAWLGVAGGLVVAHAAWALESATPAPVAELAVVVADDWQGRGLGTRLLAAVAAEAVHAGAAAVRMYVLADNRRLVARLDREWPDASRRRDGTLVVYTLTAEMAAALQGLADAPASFAHAVTRPRVPTGT